MPDMEGENGSNACFVRKSFLRFSFVYASIVSFRQNAPKYGSAFSSTRHIENSGFMGLTHSPGQASHPTFCLRVFSPLFSFACESAAGTGVHPCVHAADPDVIHPFNGLICGKDRSWN
jgi:hypothetical protein